MISGGVFVGAPEGESEGAFRLRGPPVCGTRCGRTTPGGELVNSALLGDGCRLAALQRCGRRLSCRPALSYYDAVVAKTSGLSICTRLSAYTPRPRTMVVTEMATQ
jgi:hypothetical protein